ncbi:CLUMA_CG009373, isoform A [Clunio marinus]|uniref:CLUMA_CG009373, isoform A n=1 Tax=Clunio marinus TaxID=568069 RepID=A0A1J1I6I5_9DIPT|nr:CLUMA_CG009373, isoform A [Clunio marinus]
MKNFLTFAVLLSVCYFVNANPQFFGQSFSSSSVVNPNGKVISKSIYTDSTGRRIVNGGSGGPNSFFPSLSFPSPINELVPPNLPGQSAKNQYRQQPQNPVYQPTPAPSRVTRPTSRPPTTRPPTARPTTARPTFSSGKIPSGSKSDGYYVHDNSGAYKHDDRGRYIWKI